MIAHRLGGFPDGLVGAGANGLSRSTGSSASGTTRTTTAGSAIPLNVTEPRSSYRRPSTFLAQVRHLAGREDLDRGADHLSGGGEHAERLVAAQLEQGSPATLHDLAGGVGELRSELGGGLVAALLREQRVAADVGDQERADLGLLRPVTGARAIGSPCVPHGADYPLRGEEGGVARRVYRRT